MRFFVPLYLLLFTLSVVSGRGQSILFEDGFEDGEFISNPEWTGNTDEFAIININGNHLLQLDAKSAGSSYLSTPSTNTVGYWEFYINLDGFSPSNNNNAFIYLVSDIADLTGQVNGYALQAGENSSSDVFRLFKITNGEKDKEILTGITNISAGGDYRVKISRDISGNWELEVGTGYIGILNPEDTGTDNDYPSTSYFGIKVNYTKSNIKKFAFDFRIDIPPLLVTEISADVNWVDVSLNRAYNPATVQAYDFSINDDIGSPASVSFPEDNTIRLIYDNPLPSGKYMLTVQNVEDFNGEGIATTTTPFIQFDKFAPGDVIINEFMYDPPTGAAEYIELKNTSAKYLNIKNWQLGDNNSLNIITGTVHTLEPDGYLVIAADTTVLFNTFGYRPYVHMSSFPALNNSGDAVRIVTPEGETADSLTYTPVWGGNDVAVERRSDSVPALFPENWADSPHPLGGTPGLPNEAEEDRAPPGLTDIHIPDNRRLILAFDERLESSSASDKLHYSVSGDVAITSATVLSADSVQLALSSSLNNAVTYTLTIDGLQDIFGNATTGLDSAFTYYEISIADSGDVFINEFMSDPPGGSSEYVEIYNSSAKSLDLKGWTLSDNTGQLQIIRSASFILPPDSMVVIAPDQTLLAAYPEISLISMGTRFPSLNNNGDAIVIRNASSVLLDSLSYFSGWVNEATALERRTTAVSGVYSSNWGPAPNKLGTPGRTNEIGPDVTPPGIADIHILDNHTIRLSLDERPDPGTFVQPSGYSITDGIAIDAVYLHSPNTVDLSLSSALQNASSYTLTVNGVKDIFGNVASGLDTTFTYFEILPVDSGDVFITEFMYEPPPGESEYIELYNRSDKSLDLKGWTINDNTGNARVIISEQHIFPPDSYVVIAPDQTLLKEHPDISLITMSNRFPVLNNSGDDLVIRSGSGQVLDSLRYTSAWGGAEKALERRTTLVPGIWQGNWGEASAGGSPGRPNSIPPDKSPPVLEKLTILSDTSLHLQFSERIEQHSAVLTDNFTLEPKRDIKNILAERNTVTLFLAQPLRSGQHYRVRAEGLQDLFGNTMPPATLGETYIRFGQAQRGDIVINEILFTRIDGGDPEFVELYNTSGSNFNLSGWKLGDAAGTVTLGADMQLQAGEYLALTDNPAFADSLDNVRYLAGFPSLNDAGDALYLQTDAGLTIDSLFYRANWGTAGKGISLERIDPLAASGDPSNWQSHPASMPYSPGRENTSFLPDETPPEVIFSKLISGNRIQVQFNEFIALTPELSFSSDRTPMSVESFNPAQANKVTLQLAPAKASTAETAVTLTIQNLTDVRGNTTPAAEIPIARRLEPSSVVINEIMYNPLSNPDDNLPDQSEYVELRNTKDFAVSLEGLYLHDAPDEDGEVRSLVPVATTTKWIPAQGFALIYADEEPVFNRSKTAGFFGIEHSHAASTIRIDKSSLSLAATGDAVFLADSTGTVIDSVYYSESWQNPNLIDTRGIALERIHPAGPGNDRSNWSSSASEKGGTPLSENSLYQIPDQAPAQVGIRFSPNPFSPDNDGFDDNLFINYRLDEPDYLVKVHIYDRYGRLVRKLADGRPAGFEGSLIWDGRRDNGTRNRIGIYIVVFEAYNSTNGKNRAFKKTVVLARMLN